MRAYNTKRDGVKVRIAETGEEFNSTKACADRLSACPSQVSDVVRGKRGLRTCHGYHVVRADSECGDFEIQKEYRGSPGVKVKIVETGEIFESITDCAKAINGSAGTIHDVIHKNRNRHSHKGLHFERLD